MIGLQYTITSPVLLLVGFSLMMLMRWQLAYPIQPIPFIGGLLDRTTSRRASCFQLGAMHGTIVSPDDFVAWLLAQTPR